jgi:Fe-S cluster assembly scaffold protein SufB
VAEGSAEIMDNVQKELLKQIAGLHEIPVGAYNIRTNGKTEARNSTEHIEIVPKEGSDGIVIKIKAGTKNESIHIPVVLSEAGLKETVYNDFYIGDDCDVTIIAGCGIHCGTDDSSEHDGIHSFFIGKNSKVKYVEKHYGSGDGKGQRIMNPETIVEVGENSYMEMDTAQIKGVDSTIRKTTVKLDKNASIKVMERLMTHGEQKAESRFVVDLNGENSGANIISRSVAKDNSYQLFQSVLNGNEKCSGHTECDAIIVGNAKISSIPEITANNSDAALIHEAAIGKIAGEQIIKLMTLGLTEEEAEEQIISGFLK